MSMSIGLTEEQIIKMVRVLLKNEREYKGKLVSDMTFEEYDRFLKECPEFLEDE